MKHNDFLNLQKKIFTAMGYKAHREYLLPSGELIDLVMAKDKEIITMEYEDLNCSSEKIINNLKKCLTLKPKYHLHITTTGQQYDAIWKETSDVIKVIKIADVITDIIPEKKDNFLFYPKRDLMSYIQNTYGYSERHVRRLIERQIEKKMIVKQGKLVGVNKKYNIEALIIRT
jgi:hypothetical protein